MPATADLLTNIFHLTFFGIANVFFVYAVGVRVMMMTKVQPVQGLAGWEARVRSFLLNVIFQFKLFKHPVRGIMHAFIFYGFIAYLVHTTSQMVAGNAWALFKVSGINPYTFYLTDFIWLGLSLTGTQAAITVVGLIAAIGLVIGFFSSLRFRKQNNFFTNPVLQWIPLTIALALFGGIFAILIGSGTALYESFIQYFSLFVLTGLGFFAYRRWVRQAKGLDIPSTQSAIVLLLIGTLMTSTLVGAAAQKFLDNGEHAIWINNVILYLLNGMGMNDTVTATAVRDFTWWLHLGTVYAFMIVVPQSKHSHLIFAPMNFFMVKSTPAGQMTMKDLEAEDAVWGAGNVSELPWTAMMDGLSCIECGRCTVACPANQTGKPLDPKKIMVDIKHATVDHWDSLWAGQAEDGTHAASPIIGNPYITDEELWSCTSCYACVDQCPVGNNQLEAILEMRRNLTLVEARIPAQLQTAMQNMENQSNPWGMGAHTRGDWCEDLGVKTMAEDSNVDVLYWVGCAASFDDRNKTVARSFVKIMQQANVKFAILGTEENCTGDSARRGGNEYLYQTLAQSNIDKLNEYNVKKIVTACPHCYNTLKNEYPQMGGHYEVEHHSDYIENLLHENKIEMDPAEVAKMSDRRPTYHDSCYLGRYNEVYDEPRTLIREAIGVDVSEASDHHKTSLCCGAGGAQMWMEEEYERVNEKRTGQLVDTGADLIATACPFCNVMMTDGVKSMGLQDNVKVLDVAEIVAAGMKGGNGALKADGFSDKVGASH